MSSHTRTLWTGLWLNTRAFASLAEMDPGSCTDSQVRHCTLLAFRLGFWTLKLLLPFCLHFIKFGLPHLGHHDRTLTPLATLKRSLACRAHLKADKGKRCAGNSVQLVRYCTASFTCRCRCAHMGVSMPCSEDGHNMTADSRLLTRMHSRPAQQLKQLYC